jgi:hypothetical protein
MMETPEHESILREIAEVESQLASLRDQQEKAEAKLQSLKERLKEAGRPPAPRLNHTPGLSSPTLTPDGKDELFLRLFGRSDVYPRLWKNSKTGEKGYSPASANEWGEAKTSVQ